MSRPAAVDRAGRDAEQVLDLAEPTEFENLGKGRKVISQIGGSLAAGILSPPSTSADLIHGTAPASGGLAGDN